MHAGYPRVRRISARQNPDPSTFALTNGGTPGARTTRRPLRSLQNVTNLDGSVSAFVGLEACCPFPARPDRPGPRPPPRTSERTRHDRARCLPTAAIVLSVATRPPHDAISWRWVLPPCAANPTRITSQARYRPTGASEQSPASSRTPGLLLTRLSYERLIGRGKRETPDQFVAHGLRQAPQPCQILPGEHLPGHHRRVLPPSRSANGMGIT